MNQQAAATLLNEYRIALRLLDREGPAVLKPDAVATYRLRLLLRIVEIEKQADPSLEAPDLQLTDTLGCIDLLWPERRTFKEP